MAKERFEKLWFSSSKAEDLSGGKETNMSDTPVLEDKMVLDWLSKILKKFHKFSSVYAEVVKHLFKGWNS